MHWQQDTEDPSMQLLFLQPPSPFMVSVHEHASISRAHTLQIQGLEGLWNSSPEHQAQISTEPTGAGCYLFFFPSSQTPYFIRDFLMT